MSEPAMVFGSSFKRMWSGRCSRTRRTSSASCAPCRISRMRPDGRSEPSWVPYSKPRPRATIYRASSIPTPTKCASRIWNRTCAIRSASNCSQPTECRFFKSASTERTAIGRREAAEIRSAAERDARIVRADATVKAADIEAQSKVQAAKAYGHAYASAPQLYTLLRSLDTLSTIIAPGSKVILRTDAAPFKVLVDGPPGADSGAGHHGQ